jgi:decaprenyl-phosphate phosphoribosyltransferase
MEMDRMIKKYIQLLRVQQYVKNLFIYAPIFFGLEMTNTASLVRTTFAYVCFCLISSGVYIYNDYHDREDDSKHPVKKERPIASGAISKKSALFVMVVILASGLTGGFFLGVNILIIMGVYIILNVLYTIALKHIALVDVFIIASGFVLRLFVGSKSSNVQLSMWIIIMTFLLALFLAFGKRREDVILYLDKGEKARKSIEGYNLEFLNIAMIIMAAIIIISYIMYAISPDILKRVHGDKTYFTVLWVILGILRYLQKSFVFNDTGSPTKVFLTDRFLQLVMAGWIISLVLLIYLP